MVHRWYTGGFHPLGVRLPTHPFVFPRTREGLEGLVLGFALGGMMSEPLARVCPEGHDVGPEAVYCATCGERIAGGPQRGRWVLVLVGLLASAIGVGGGYLLTAGGDEDPSQAATSSVPATSTPPSQTTEATTSTDPPSSTDPPPTTAPPSTETPTTEPPTSQIPATTHDCYSSSTSECAFEVVGDMPGGGVDHLFYNVLEAAGGDPPTSISCERTAYDPSNNILEWTCNATFESGLNRSLFVYYAAPGRYAYDLGPSMGGM